MSNKKFGNAENVVRATVNRQVQEINRKVRSRGEQAVNALRNAEREILSGQRSGRVYKKPQTYGGAKKGTKKLAKEYGHKLRGGQLYRASAPGEPPARRTGNLRLHWRSRVKTGRVSGNSVEVIAVLESNEPYAYALENGTSKMAPRPFVDRIKEKALPEIEKIYKEPYK